MKALGVGIIGIGSHLPPQIRTNDFWPLDSFRSPEADIGNASTDLPKTGSRKIVLEELSRWKDDPFHGAVERRVLADDLKSSDMEVEAGKAAIANAGLTPADIDLMLLHTFLPDRAVPGNSGPVHKRLGLPTNTMAVGTDGVCGTFPLQLQLGAAHILSGAAKHVLLIQSSLQSRCLDHSKPLSVAFGDGATAVVLGRVAPDKGLLGSVTSNDGSFADATVVATEPDRRWYEGNGKLIITSCNFRQTKQFLIELGEMAQTSVHAALAEAGLKPAQVDFFTSHQTIAAFSSISRRAAGLDHARYVDTFKQVASMGSCNIPYNLQVAEREGMIRDGDVAALFTTGGGANWSTVILRWGK